MSDKLTKKLEEAWQKLDRKLINESPSKRRLLKESEQAAQPPNEFIIPPEKTKEIPLDAGSKSEAPIDAGSKSETPIDEADESGDVKKPSLMGTIPLCGGCGFNEDMYDDVDDESDITDIDTNIDEARAKKLPEPIDVPDFDPLAGTKPSSFNRDMYKQELKHAATGSKTGLNVQPDPANPGEEEPVFSANKQDPSTYGDREGERTSKFGMNIKDDPDAYLNELKTRMLVTPPDNKLFGQNAKLAKSGDKSTIFFDFTLPAYSGIYYSEKLDDFQMLTTCPQAGACKKFCYARKGNFTQYPANHLARSQTLSYLINHPKEFVERMINKIKSVATYHSRKGKKVHFRWHDSGDWFSPTYARMALFIASKTPNVLHYAYTKQVEMIKSLSDEVPENFIFNYSFAGIQDDAIDRSVDKFSFVLKPEEDMEFKFGSFQKAWRLLMAAQKVEKDARTQLNSFKKAASENLTVITKKKKVGNETVPYEIPVDIDGAKKKLSDAEQGVESALRVVDKECMNDIFRDAVETKLGLPKGSVVTYFEMVDIPEDPNREFKLSVLVYPGCGDISAARRDVSGTLLLIH